MELNFDFRGFETVYDLSLHKRLFETLEKELKVVSDRTAEAFRKETVVENEEDYGLLCSTLNGLEDEAQRQQQTLRATEIIRLHVLFEGHLKFLCQAIGTASGLKLGLSNLNGSLVERGKLFLSDYSGALPKTHKVWSEIGLLHRLRNYLVHASVEMGTSDRVAEVKRLAKSCQRFQLLEDGNLSLSRELCAHLQESVKELFSLLFDVLGWKAFKQ
jgi:hypothetical protein